MKFIVKTRVNAATGSANGCKVDIEYIDTGKKETLESDVVLVAAGRRAYTAGLQLDKAGITVDKWGKVDINEHWQTNVQGIYAIGDVVKGAMLAHKAEEEGIAAVEYILGEGGHVNYKTIPGVIYTYPEVASVGQTEEELKTAGVAYKKGSFPFMANSRARTNNDSEGQVKVLMD